jgi:hypothetical protein
MRPRRGKVFHNGGWYNQESQKIGYGDLSDEDIKRLTRLLQEGECLIVLHEYPSRWDFKENYARLNPHGTEGDPENPGGPYLLTFAAAVVAPGKYHKEGEEKFDTTLAEILGLDKA